MEGRKTKTILLKSLSAAEEEKWVVIAETEINDHLYDPLRSPFFFLLLHLPLYSYFFFLK